LSHLHFIVAAPDQRVLIHIKKISVKRSRFHPILRGDRQGAGQQNGGYD
jgi:hypothetical protein